MPLPSLLALLMSGGENPVAPTPRFELASPLTTVPGVMIDRFTTGYGLAQETVKAKNLQGRVMWIDATANLDRYNTEEKIVGLVKKIAEVGFNTIVFDIKPISGQVVYNSRLAPKLTEWRGKTMPLEFDPLPLMIREGHANGLSVLASLNAFSEGHRLFKVGPGYNKPTLQTILYEGRPVLRAGDQKIDLATGVDAVPVGRLGVVSNVRNLPEDGYAVAIRKDGTVVDRGLKSVAPKGGALLAGSGDAAVWLQNYAVGGERLQFDTEAEYVPIRDRPEQQYPLMMNPLNPQVQQYALQIVREVVQNYEIDGLLFDDRLRYGGMNADFSELTRAKFEEKLKKKLVWPDDVFKWTLTPQMVRGLKPGAYYDEWMAFRAEELQKFVLTVRHTVKALRPKCLFGAYAGSWYGEYPVNGHNYASPSAEAGFWFLSPAYQKTGTAPLLDLLLAGCYYPTATIHEAMAKGVNIGSTVEASGTLVNRLIRDEAWTYAGIALSDFKDDPDGLSNALQGALAATQGVMVFDLSHDVEPSWPVFARAFAQRREAPHMNPSVLADIKRRRAALDRLGQKEPPIVIAAGSAGTGQ